MKKKKDLWLFAVLLLLILSMGKYCLNGERYVFETENTADEVLLLNTGNSISQQIIIDKRSKWNTDSYGVKLSYDSDKSGKLKFIVSQNENIQQQYTEDLKTLRLKDGWYVFQGFDYSKLKRSEAVITIEAVKGSVGVFATENTYNIPNCMLDGRDTGKTLVQRYMVPYVNREYILRLFLYIVFVLLLFGMGYILTCREENKRICNIAQLAALASYIIIVYIYNSSFFFEPTWAEAVTNFMSAAKTERLWKNIIMSDAGYLPLFQRLITVFLIQILHMTAYDALFLMQIIAYMLTGYMLSFFCKINYRGYLDLKCRFIVSLIIMMQTFNHETGAFINFIVYGIYVMFLFLIADSKEWSYAKNFGQFNSPYYGMLQSSGDCTIVMACDYQDPVEMIPRYIREWECGYKIVIGIKTSSKENPVMYRLRSFYYTFIRKFSDVEQIEHFTGFGLYDKEFVEILRNLKDPTPFLRGIVAEFGFKRMEIAYEQPVRRAGKTNNNFYSLYDAAMLSVTSYTKIGLRLCTFLGIAASCISFAVAIVYLVLKLLYWDRFQAGMSPILIGMFMLSAVQLFFIGMIGEYILSISKRIMNRPLVIEEERLNFDEK